MTNRPTAPTHTLLRLESAHCCALIEWETGRMPVWRHFGALLTDTSLTAQWPAAALRRQANASMDRLDGNPVFPGFGNGLSLNPALRAHADGRGAVHEWVAASFTQSESAAAQTLLLHLQDASGLALDLHLTLWRDSDVLSLHSTLHNRSAHTVQLDWQACACIPVATELSEVAHFSGQWGHEFQWQRTALAASGWQMQNRHGRSSHEAPPACFALTPHSSDHQGEVIAAQLAWSGNHQFALDRCDDGSALLQAGVWLAPGEVRLAPGASERTPELHVSWSGCGLNGVSQNFHRFARQQVLQWPSGSMRPRPVHLNTWEAVYFNHDDATLRALAERAAAIGVERFVLDDGWFPGRPDDHSGLGDWWPDAQKYPQGLGPLFAHVQALGMEFGLWVEPEMVNPASALFRAHPDWALQVAGHALQLGRQQLVLDIARPEVSAYLFEKLDTLLRENRISYLKWDMNRDLAQAADAQGQLAYARQVPALYALLQRLREQHPALEIESCASGGGRMDLGILQHTQRFWTSDNNDAVSRIAIQSGAARLFPLEVLGAHVGPAPAHTTGRSQSLELRCAVALFGHMGVEADVRKLTPEEAHTLGHWIAIYKAWRGVLHGGTFSQGRTASGVWWLAQNGARAILGVFTQRAPTSMHHAPLRLPGLVGDGLWQLRLLGTAGQERARGDARAPWLDALRQDGVRCSAAELQNIGLPLPNMNPESALVFSLELANN
jgi:alpha-galactosidase